MRRPGPAGGQDFRARVSVAVEDCDAAADEVLPSAGIDMLNRQGDAAIDESRVRESGAGQKDQANDTFHWAAISLGGMSSPSVTEASASAAAP